MTSMAATIDPALRIETAHLAVADLDASVDFYTRVMGLGVASRSGGVAELAAREGPALISLTQLDEPTPASPRAAGLFHLALLHPTRGDLADTVLRIARSGWRFTGASDHGVSEALYLRDPDGLGLEVYADRPREAWGRLDDGTTIDMFTAPLDVEDLMRTRPESADTEPGIAPATVMGHVHLQVGDVARSLRFYRDAVGLDLMASVPGAAFLAAGGYHHHLGVNEWNSTGAAPSPPTAPGLRLVQLRVSDAAQVEALEDRLAAHDVAATRDETGALRLRDPDAVALSVAA